MRFHADLKKLAKENKAFRRVIETGKNLQLVLMSVDRHESLGEEVHPITDQVFYVVDGKGEAVLDGRTQHLDERDVVFVPAGVKHDLRNTGKEPLKLFTLYAPPMHLDGLVQMKKEELAGTNPK